jgi:hypothetical protein
MSHYHAVVWVDAVEAHVIGFNRDEAEMALVHARAGSREVHQRAAGPSRDDAEFFRRIADAVRTSGEVLLVGPAATKLQLLKWWQVHDPAVAAKVVGVESADHPADGQLLKHARLYFEAADRMRPRG